MLEEYEEKLNYSKSFKNVKSFENLMNAIQRESVYGRTITLIEQLKEIGLGGEKLAFEGLAERLQGQSKRLKVKEKLTEQDVKEMMREVRFA